MEHAIWKGEELTAFEVAEDYFYEKKVREAGKMRLEVPSAFSLVIMSF